MQRGILLLILLSFGALAGPARSEVPSRSPRQLREDAAHIVVGKVQQVYTATSQMDDWETTSYVAEIAVDSVEKGDRSEPGGLVYVRFWRVKWLGSDIPPPHASGHCSVAKGDAVRVYLTEDKKDKGLEVILPNGFQKVDKAVKKEA